MKSLRLLPLIAVIAVNGLYFPENGKEQLELDLRNSVNTTTAEPSRDCESNGGECKKNKKQCKGTIDTENTCSKNGVCCVVEAKAQGASELMLQILLTNTILIQRMAAQTLKEDQENSMRNLTDAIANLKMAGDIKISNLSDAVSDQGVAIQGMIGNLTDTISNQGMALQINQDSIMSNLSDAISSQGMALHINQDSIMSNLSDAISSQGMSLQINQDSIMSNLSDGFSDQENMLGSMENNQDIMMSNLTRIGCPEGFFQLSPSNQCLKFFFDVRRTWTAANSKCQAEGLVSAQPSDPLELQKYIVNKYGYGYPGKGDPYTWVPARGTGSSNYRWYPNGGYLYAHNPYWHTTPTSTYMTTSYCIYMLNHNYYMKHQPGRPYSYISCTGSLYTVCELVKE